MYLSTRSAEDSIWKNVQTFLFNLFVADFAVHLKSKRKVGGQLKKNLGSSDQSLAFLRNFF